MSNNPILGFNDIIMVETVESLIELYKQKGIEFSNRRDFLRRVRKDWKTEYERFRKEAFSKPTPDKLPSLEVVVDETYYQIFGIHHGEVEKADPRYSSLISEVKRDNLLLEQGLRDFYRWPNVEILDLAANSNLEAFKYLFILSFFPLELPHLFSAEHVQIKGAHLHELNIPIEAFGELPAYLGVQIRRSLSYDQRKSAYQAEFMRAWKKGEDKSIIVGRLHAAEIKYFLKNPIRSNRVQELAQYHAELAETDPGRYLAEFEGVKSSRSKYMSIGSTAGFATSLLCCATIPVGLALILYKVMK